MPHNADIGLFTEPSNIFKPDSLDLFEICLYMITAGDDITMTGEQIVCFEPGNLMNTLFKFLSVSSRQICSPHTLIEDNIACKENFCFRPV